MAYLLGFLRGERLVDDVDKVDEIYANVCKKM